MLICYCHFNKPIVSGSIKLLSGSVFAAAERALKFCFYAFQHAYYIAVSKFYRRLKRLRQHINK